MKWQIKVRKDPNPFLARVIIAGKKWKANPEESKKLLADISQKWPKDKKVSFLIACGGFTQFDWPKSISRSDVGNNKYPNKKALEELVAKAKECARFILSDGLDKKLKEFTDYITLGIDSYIDSLKELHIELVFLINLTTNQWHLTGKSYPIIKQEKGLVRISDLKTHFVDLKDSGKIMILGCFDLNLLINRGRKAKSISWRESLRNDFQELSRKKEPIYVLHHPHTTVKKRTWLAAWGALRKTLPSVKNFAGAGRYYDPDIPRLKWDYLDDVLEKTKCGDTIDFIVCMNEE